MTWCQTALLYSNRSNASNESQSFRAEDHLFGDLPRQVWVLARLSDDDLLRHF